MRRETIFVVILVLLVLISVVQAFQLSGLRNQVESIGEIKISKQKTAVSSGPSSSSSASVPPNIKNLPQMVGGC